MYSVYIIYVTFCVYTSFLYLTLPNVIVHVLKVLFKYCKIKVIECGLLFKWFVTVFRS